MIRAAKRVIEDICFLYPLTRPSQVVPWLLELVLGLSKLPNLVPLAEAVILVYWRGCVLCYATAQELHYQDGTCRSYWFPHPRLGD